MLYWNKALWLDTAIHVTILTNQSYLFQHRVTEICLWHRIQVRLSQMQIISIFGTIGSLDLFIVFFFCLKGKKEFMFWWSKTENERRSHGKNEWGMWKPTSFPPAQDRELKITGLGGWCKQVPSSCLYVGRDQWDQIGQFIGLWATFQSLCQQLICPNLPHS